MLAAIREARRTIRFETYIYWSGRIGNEFAEALSERSRTEVEKRFDQDHTSKDSKNLACRSGFDHGLRMA